MAISDELTIVVVEDDPGHARLIELVLREIGVDNPVLFIGDGSDADACLFGRDARAESFVLFLDLNLPGLDGVALLKRIRATEATKTIPVVVITSSADPGDEAQCRKQGADAFMLKPPDPDKLRGVLGTLGLLST